MERILIAFRPAPSPRWPCRLSISGRPIPRIPRSGMVDDGTGRAARRRRRAASSAGGSVLAISSRPILDRPMLSCRCQDLWLALAVCGDLAACRTGDFLRHRTATARLMWMPVAGACWRLGSRGHFRNGCAPCPDRISWNAFGYTLASPLRWHKARSVAFGG